MRQAVVREYLSWRRRGSSGERATATLPDQPDRPGGDVERLAERDEVWRCLAVLPRAQRAVLALRYYEDLPDSEIGAEPATVSQRRSGSCRLTPAASRPAST